MKAIVDSGCGRGRFRGTLQIFRYNWPSYVVGALACLTTLALAQLPAWPSWVRLALSGGAACAGFWLMSSLLASYWVYDRSALCRWDWIAELFPVAPSRWTNIHAGLDETTLKLRELFPGGTIVVERVCGFPKSFVVHQGFDRRSESVGQRITRHR